MGFTVRACATTKRLGNADGAAHAAISCSTSAVHLG
jgi:hypothetical protein